MRKRFMFGISLGSLMASFTILSDMSIISTMRFLTSGLSIEAYRRPISCMARLPSRTTASISGLPVSSFFGCSTATILPGKSFEKRIYTATETAARRIKCHSLYSGKKREYSSHTPAKT